MPGTVWVLGAGFSKPLGGPLLFELFTPAALASVRDHFPANEYKLLWKDDLPTKITAAYQYGTGFEKSKEAYRYLGDRTGEHLWANPEEFLARLDEGAARKTGAVVAELARAFARSQNSPSPPIDVGQVAPAAKRLLAAQCSRFTQEADIASERWLAHENWYKRLTASRDTVLTFNYDLTIERLAAHAKHPKLHVRLPQTPLDTEPTIPLYKLHGSVNWTRRPSLEPGNGESPVVLADGPTAIEADDDALVIAAPGPTKMSSSTGFLRELWVDSLEKLRQAEAIVFVGYRFPETDAFSRERILQAIRENSSPYLAIHLVLGAQNVDTARLAQLMRFSLGRRAELPPAYHPPSNQIGRYRFFSLIQHPMYGEEFFSAVFPHQITQPTLVGFENSREFRNEDEVTKVLWR